MTLGRLLVRSLLYHWRGNSAVLLGVVVGTAVLTGALLVGDSLRGSLRKLTRDQLGWVDHSLVAGRFIRQSLAGQLDAYQISPVILLQGSASAVAEKSSASPDISRAGRVMILGVDESFWAGYGSGRPSATEGWSSREDEAILNASLAEELGVAVGQTITLYLQKSSAIPRETLLGRRDPSDVLGDWPVTVRAILPDQGPGRFNLHPSPATPRNAFVPLSALQARLGQPGRINGLLAAGGDVQTLQARLRSQLTLDDWGLELHSPQSRARDWFAKLDRDHDGKLQRREWQRRLAKSIAEAIDQDRDGVLTRAEVEQFLRARRNYLSLESRQLLLEPVVEDAALEAAKGARLRTGPTLVYLANSIRPVRSNRSNLALSETQEGIPYSVVAALDPALPPPLGLPGGKPLNDSEVLLVDWKDSPIDAGPGDDICFEYFLPEAQEPDLSSMRHVQSTSSRGPPAKGPADALAEVRSQLFRVVGRVPLDGGNANPDLTPEFPGITDKLDLRNWNPPFPYDNRRVKPRDERYWDDYRTTPKAYISLAAGQRLWGSRFGQLTSIRLAPMDEAANADLTPAAVDFERRLLDQLTPEAGGLVFEPVRQRGLSASTGSTDFGMLFLGFSFFLILAALLLVGLLMRLNLDRRAAEIGLLIATGFRGRTVRWLLLGEGTLLAAVGGILGLPLSTSYAWLMLKYLASSWPGGLEASILQLHVTGLSLAIGYVASLIVSVATIAWAVRVLGRVAPAALLHGATVPAASTAAPRTAGLGNQFLAWGSLLAALALALAGIPARDTEMQAGCFFGSGFLLLTGALALFWRWLTRTQEGRIGGRGRPALTRLAIRNAARHPVRSLLTAGLLASAAFLVVAVESFHKDLGQELLDRKSGTGGFTLLAECDTPIFQNLNRPEDRDQLSFPPESSRILQDVRFYACRLRAGEDASCLNLYQPGRPRILGVPPDLIESDRFSFQYSNRHLPSVHVRPWLPLVNAELASNEVAAFGDFNTVKYILHSGLDETIPVPDGQGRLEPLRIVGVTHDSIFQSELLVSEASFLKLYPRQEGYQFFLIDAPPERAVEVKHLLETVLAPYGFTVTPAARRLEAYLAVENTYLSTFQALGGLGLLLGTIGLAVVLLRSAWERRGEFALLRALGFRRAALGWLVFAENSYLLVVGLAIGAMSALLAVAPHLALGNGSIPLGRLGALLVGALAVGLAALAAAVATTLRAPLLQALRGE